MSLSLQVSRPCNTGSIQPGDSLWVQTPLRPFPFAVVALNLNRPRPDILSIPFLPDSESKWPKNRINVQRIRARLSRDSQFLVLRKY